MPVHFSPSSKTSLAESELEYNSDHESPSLYLALPLFHDESHVRFKKSLFKMLSHSNCRVNLLL